MFFHFFFALLSSPADKPLDAHVLSLAKALPLRQDAEGFEQIPLIA